MTTIDKAPVHLWIVGAVSALWNSFGVIDYMMTQTGNQAWLSQLEPALRAYVESAPVWANVAWAFGVWGAFAGSLLLLLRRRLAIPAFAASLGGLAFNTFWQFGASDGLTIMGSSALWMNLTIWAVAIALLVYALRMKSAGVLR
jgi:hypothetical protein